MESEKRLSTVLMDELEQRCYDLDSKVKLVEEERDAVMTENEELQDQINALRMLVEATEANSMSKMGLDEPTREEILRLSEEVSRMDTTLNLLKDNFRSVNEKMKDISVLKDTLRAVSEETSCVKEDFLNLKNHLNLAAKIELQTNEKMYENRLHHLEKMLEEMRHREESFLHIAEETNILKDQVDSLRELSLNSLKCEQVNFTSHNAFRNQSLPLNEELYRSGSERPASLPISYDSPVTEQPLTIAFETKADPSVASTLTSTMTSASPLKITGQVKLNLTSGSSMSKNSEGTQTEVILTPPSKQQMTTSVGTMFRDKVMEPIQPTRDEKKSEYKVNCCTDLMARIWGTLFD